MSKKKLTFEQKALNNINSLQEGLLFGILKFLMKSKTKTLLRRLHRDPEFKANIADLNYTSKELERKIKDFQKKYGHKPGRFRDR